MAWLSRGRVLCFPMLKSQLVVQSCTVHDHGGSSPHQLLPGCYAATAATRAQHTRAGPSTPRRWRSSIAMLALCCALMLARAPLRLGASALDVDTLERESARFGGPNTHAGLCSALSQRIEGGTPLSPIPDPATWPRIYDVFPVNDDLDMLEIRLYELHTVVDFFVIGESNVTFTNRAKRIRYRDIKDRFRRFWSQIIYVPVDTFNGVDGTTVGVEEHAWKRETGVRSALLMQGIHPGDWREIRENDIILFGDLDEIPRPSVLLGLRACQGYSTVGKARLEMRFAYYAYSVRHASIKWTGAIAARYHNTTVYSDGSELRGSGYGGDSVMVHDAGWHCSSCLRTYAQFVSKLRGFSHVREGSNPLFLSREHLVRVIRTNSDLFDRPDQTYVFEEVGPEDAPLEVLMHKERYRYLLDRRDPTAGIEGLEDR